MAETKFAEGYTKVFPDHEKIEQLKQEVLELFDQENQEGKNLEAGIKKLTQQCEFNKMHLILEHGGKLLQLKNAVREGGLTWNKWRANNLQGTSQPTFDRWLRVYTAREKIAEVAKKLNIDPDNLSVDKFLQNLPKRKRSANGASKNAAANPKIAAEPKPHTTVAHTTVSKEILQNLGEEKKQEEEEQFEVCFTAPLVIKYRSPFTREELKKQLGEGDELRLMAKVAIVDENGNAVGELIEGHFDIPGIHWEEEEAEVELSKAEEVE